MTDLEDRLRQTLSAEAERAQPGMLRPLRAPRRPTAMGWRPVLTGGRALLVAVRIGVSVPESPLTT